MKLPRCLLMGSKQLRYFDNSLNIGKLYFQNVMMRKYRVNSEKEDELEVNS
jgi:hypothetical protein